MARAPAGVAQCWRSRLRQDVGQTVPLEDEPRARGPQPDTNPEGMGRSRMPKPPAEPPTAAVPPSAEDALSTLPPTRDDLMGQAKGRGDDGLFTLLRRWRDEIRVRANAQQIAAADDARNNLVLGVLVTTLAAIGASGILTGSSDVRVTSMAGLITLLAAVLAGVQTVVRFGERSGAHRGAAASFGRVKTRLDLL